MTNNYQQTLYYRGHYHSGSGLTLLLEDSITGEYFDISDFDGYRKEGLDVVFYIGGFDGEHTYLSRNKTLLALLP